MAAAGALSTGAGALARASEAVSTGLEAANGAVAGWCCGPAAGWGRLAAFGPDSPAAPDPPAVISSWTSVPSTLKMHCLSRPAFSCLLEKAVMAPVFEKATVRVRPSKPASDALGSTVIQRNFFSDFRTSMISGQARRNISTEPAAPERGGPACWPVSWGGCWPAAGPVGWAGCCGGVGCWFGPACAAAFGGEAGRCCTGPAGRLPSFGRFSGRWAEAGAVRAGSGSGSGTTPQAPPQSRDESAAASGAAGCRGEACWR